MRKTFLAVYFIMAAISYSAQAAVTEIKDLHELRESEEKHKRSPVQEEPRIQTKEQFINFIKSRAKNLYTTELDEDGVSAHAMDIQHSAEYIAKQQQENKTTFQKIYEAAIDRVSSQPSKPARTDVIDNSSQPTVPEQSIEWKKPNYDVINVELPPRGEKELVPAKEHIPYLFADVQITPTGVVDVTDTIVVVANGEKLKYGLTRAVHKFSTSRSGKRTKADLTLISVTVNGNEVPYKLEEDDKFILMVPRDKKFLDPGVYTYQFKYVMDKRLWYYEDFNELYWDVTGSSWNLVIGRIGAALTLPNGADPLGYSVLTGYPAYYNQIDTVASKLDAGTTGFIAKRPLFIGEGIHIIASLPKDVFTPPSWSRMFYWFIDDYGDILFCAMGFIAIMMSYFISWQKMNSKDNKQKAGLKKSSAMLRYLSKGVFDKISFASFILELFKRNILDIQKENNEFFLIKKADSLKGFSRKEKAAINDLFVNKESVLNINAHNSLKLKRAYKAVEQDTFNKFKNFGLKLNLGYLFFSIGMLIISQIFMSSVKVDMFSTLTVSVFCSTVFALLILAWGLNFKKSIINNVMKIVIAMAVVVNLFILTVFIHPIAALLIMVTIFTIFGYTKLFAKRSGLIKHNIQEAVEYGDFIIRNKEIMGSGRNFVNQQPNIFALEIVSEFPKTPLNQDVYRLDIISELAKKL